MYLIAPITKNLLEVPTGLILEEWQLYGLDTPSKILFHQIRVIDAERIMKPIGKITNPQIQKEIEDKIRLTFAL